MPHGMIINILTIFVRWTLPTNGLTMFIIYLVKSMDKAQVVAGSGMVKTCPGTNEYEYNIRIKFIISLIQQINK